MIRVIWYFTSGRESHAHDFATVAAAYERLRRTGMDALVFPTNAAQGVYRWDRSDDRHTLEALSARMDQLVIRGKL